MSTIAYTNTKADIWNAYKALLKERKALERKVSRLERTASKAPAPVASAPQAAPSAAPAAPSTIDGVISGLGLLQTGFRESASGLQDELIREANRLAELRSQAAALTARIERQHGIKVEDVTLEQLITGEIEAAAADEDALAGRQSAFEAEMSRRRAEWTREKETRAATTSERRSDHNRDLQREATEYAYGLERRRSADEDGDSQRRKQLEKTLAAFEAETRAAWSARHEALLEREEEFETLSAKYKAFPDELHTAIKKAGAEGEAIARRTAESAARLAAKTVEGKQRVNQLRIESLEGTIARQQVRIDRLGAQLDAALEQARQLAVKALEGTASANSFAAIREIALEQAKNTKNGK